MRCSRQGVVLIAAVMLMVLVSLSVLGLSHYIVQALILTDTKLNRGRNQEAAFAGVQSAIYSYRFRDRSGNGSFPLGQFSLNANESFVLGGSAADLLMVNTNNVRQNRRTVNRIDLQNATTSQSITIDRMVVDWNNNRRLRDIRIGGRRVWRGNAQPPVDADINNTTLNTDPDTYRTRLRFSGRMDGATITIRFVMTDGSQKELQVLPAWPQFNFTVSSTGKVAGEPDFQTLVADYNAITGTIEDLRESGTEITP